MIDVDLFRATSVTRFLCVCRREARGQYVRNARRNPNGSNCTTRRSQRACALAGKAARGKAMHAHRSEEGFYVMLTPFRMGCALGGAAANFAAIPSTNRTRHFPLDIGFSSIDLSQFRLIMLTDRLIVCSETLGSREPERCL